MFITNKHDHYFEVQGNIDTALLVDCIVHPTEHAMLSYVSAQYGLQLDEVEGNTILLEQDDEGIWLIYWLNGYTAEVDDIEEYISNFQL